MNAPDFKSRTWFGKFQDAFRGVTSGIRGQSSFIVHIPVAIVVIAMASFFGVSRWEWCALVLCIVGVLTAELFNSAIEFLSRAVDTEYNENVGAALDIASGAVLVMSIGAVAVGLIIFVQHLF